MAEPRETKAAKSGLLPGRQAAVGFILVSVWLDVLSLGVIIPAYPKLVQHFAGGDAAKAGLYVGLFGSLWCVAQFFGGPIQGALSDRFGRRPVLLVSLFGLGLDYLVMAFSPTLWWLLVGRVLSGFTAASMPVASAYIADTTPPERRAATFGMIGAAWGVGFIAGPSIGGLLGDFGVRLPFLGAAALTLVGALYGLFVLPESLKRENRSPFSWGKANPVASIAFLGSHRELFTLSAVNFLLQLAHGVLPTIFVLYASNRYGWDLKATGAALALTGVCNILVQGLLVRRVVNWIGEWGAVFTGLVSGAIGFAIYGVAPSGALFLAGTPVFALMGLFGPGFQALITRRVGANEQGRLQGANASLTGLAGVISPTVFGATYAWFLSPGHPYVPGSAFLLAALFNGLGALIAIAAMARAPSRTGAAA